MRILCLLIVLAQMRLIMMTRKRISHFCSSKDGERYFHCLGWQEFHLQVRQVGVHFLHMFLSTVILLFSLHLMSVLIKMETLERLQEMDKIVHLELVVPQLEHIKHYKKMKPKVISKMECMINKWIPLSIYSSLITKISPKQITTWLR